MKKIIKRIRKKPILTMIALFFVLYILSTTCLIYIILKVANIENLLRYLISILLALFSIFITLQCYKIVFRSKTVVILLFGIFLFGIFSLESYACGLMNGLYNSLNNIYKNKSTYSTSLIVMSTNKVNNIKDFNNFKIGMISDTNSIDGYIISKEIIKENNLEKSNQIIEYETIGDIINALYNNDISAAFVSSTYVSMFTNNYIYKNINSETKIVYSKSKDIKKEESTNNKNLNTPFSILVLGIDSIEHDISKVTSFNADSLMIITFNPKTYNATMISIPRDTYVPIACLKNKPESKITHSGWYSETCVVQTVEEWMNINIDYYVKMNFTGIVNLVNAVDGIEIDVPYSFCEQDSNRLWGPNTIYVEKGIQTLNGEQALALSRNRHPNVECGLKWSNYSSSDITRGQNQQLVINALVNKITKNINLDKIYSILDVIGKNMDTNMTTNDILSYYNIAKKIALNSFNNTGDIISFERLTLKTYDKSIYDPLTKLAGSSEQIYYFDSYNEVVQEMKTNLEIENPKLIKTFNFSINNPYKKKTIGEGIFKQADIETMPNFKNKDKSVAISWATEKGIKINIEYEDVSEGTNDFVLKQSIPATYILKNYDALKGLTITVAKLNKDDTTSNINSQSIDDKTEKFPSE